MCRQIPSLFPEGHTVGALIHGGIALMGTYQDSLQRTEILLAAVVCALLNGTLDTLVCMAVHVFYSSFFRDSASITGLNRKIQKDFSLPND